MRRTALAVAALLVGASPVFAAGAYVTRKVQDGSGTILQSYWDESGVGIGPFDPVAAPPSGFSSGGGSTTVNAAPATAAGAYSGATITGTSTQVLAAASRTFLDLKNESLSQPIACSLGGTAALNTAGSFTIAPGAAKVWEGSFVPSDAVNCITTAGNNAPLTIGAK